MHETELKFQVPHERRAAVRRAVASSTARTLRLRAIYFDTADRRLAAAGMALRLRKEGRRWVQTLKSAGTGSMQRAEHEVVLPASGAAPALDWTRHAGTPPGSALRKVLGEDGAALQEVFRTDVKRLHRVLRAAGGVQVELALDEGEIRAGAARLAIFEVEFELLKGPPSGLTALAGRWVGRHGLWLDVRSKAQRGHRLAQDAGAADALRAVPANLGGNLSGPQMLARMLAAALAQVLGNASELAAGAGEAEHLHQCRVGLRRLRSALRDFGALGGQARQETFSRWNAELAGLFRRLGQARDLDVLRESLIPRLLAAGGAMPPLPQLPPVDQDCGPILREPGCGQLWLEMLGHVHDVLSLPPAAVPRADAACAQDFARRRLHRLHRQVAAAAKGFAGLDEASQHRARKRLKRLRYGTEFCASLLAARAVTRYLEALRPAQEALGELNDLVVARNLFAAQGHEAPATLFALGWLAGQRPALLRRCGKALAALARAPQPWEGGRRAVRPARGPRASSARR